MTVVDLQSATDTPAAEALEEAIVPSQEDHPLTASVQGATSARSVPSQGEQPLRVSTGPVQATSARCGWYHMALDNKGYLVRTDCLAEAVKFCMVERNGIVTFRFTDGRYAGYGLSASGSWGLGAYKSAAGWRFTANPSSMQCCDIIGTCASKDKFVNMLENTDKKIYCNEDYRKRTCEVKLHRHSSGLVSLSIKKEARAFSVQ